MAPTVPNAAPVQAELDGPVHGVRRHDLTDPERDRVEIDAGTADGMTDWVGAQQLAAGRLEAGKDFRPRRARAVSCPTQSQTRAR